MESMVEGTVDPELIRAMAKEAGFALCRFAEAGVAPHAEAFESWLARGAHGTMTYLERTRQARVQPRAMLPDTRTVIVLGSPFASRGCSLRNWREELRGRIAAYALGADYHDVIRWRLRNFCQRIKSVYPNAVCYAEVDTGPVLERDWAWTSGVGWFGKNTNILNPHFGSLFFLAVVMTNLDVPPDAQVPDRCGRCVRCIPACPTGALDGDYGLDARRCISYWTIEHRGSIPQRVRATLGEWVFGCDICQDVCPWNEKKARSLGLEPSMELHPFLPELLSLTDEEFRQRYRRTALWRAKREGIARNAAVVLGNSGNPDAVPFLARALASDPSAVVRAHAAWALGQIGTTGALDALLDHLRRETDPTVIAETQGALRAAA